MHASHSGAHHAGVYCTHGGITGCYIFAFQDENDARIHNTQRDMKASQPKLVACDAFTVSRQSKMQQLQ